jgi:hypothetical protein
MADTYQISKALADHVDQVIAHLGIQIGKEPAILRVVERLQIVLQDALGGGNPEDMASVLKPCASLD